MTANADERKKPSVTWWERNCGWFVPTVALGAILFFAAAVLAFIIFIVGLLKNSEPGKEALVRLRTIPAVTAALGEPIQEGFFVAGSIQTDGSAGAAALQIPVSGPRGKGTLDVEARKRLGVWHFDHVVLILEGDAPRIDITEYYQSPNAEAPEPKSAPDGPPAGRPDR
jgi:hypothetical protein